MLVIRLTRKGKKNQPFFKVVVIDKKRSAKGGRAVEFLGFFDPLTKRKSLNKERILYWLKVGAQPSATMHNLLVREKIILGKKINVSKAKPVVVVEASVTEGSKKPLEVNSSNIEVSNTEVKTSEITSIEPETSELDKVTEKQ